MRTSWTIAAALSLVSIAGCGGMTGVTPVGPSPTISSAQVPLSSTPAATEPEQRIITGSVGPLLSGTAPCYLERYSCAVYRFSMRQAGAVEVTLTWEGRERALLIQLHEAGSRLVHEDLAPRGGPARIWFRRTDLEARDYEVSVVNLESDSTIPFTLTVRCWD